MHILSFDCANRTLGYCLLSVDLSGVVLGQVADILAKCTARDDPSALCAVINQCAEMLREVIKPVLFGVKDIVGVKLKETKALERARALHSTLETLRGEIAKLNITLDAVVVENQTGSFGSRSFRSTNSEVATNIVFYWCDMNVICVSAGEKNKLDFNGKTIADYRATHRSYEGANKAHSRENIRFVCKVMGFSMLDHVSVGQHDDLGDAYMQAFMIPAIRDCEDKTPRMPVAPKAPRLKIVASMKRDEFGVNVAVPAKPRTRR